MLLERLGRGPRP